MTMSGHEVTKHTKTHEELLVRKMLRASFVAFVSSWLIREVGV